MKPRNARIQDGKEQITANSFLTRWDKAVITVLFLQLLVLIFIEYYSGAESWMS